MPKVDVAKETTAVVAVKERPTPEQMAAMYAGGLSYEKIGVIAGISKQAVQQAMKRAGYDPAGIKHFRDNESDSIAGKRKMILAAMDQKKAEKASIRDLSISYGVLYDKGRLQDDRSTENIFSIHALAKAAGALEPYASKPCGPGEDDLHYGGMYAWDHPHTPGQFEACRNGACNRCRDLKTCRRCGKVKTGDRLGTSAPCHACAAEWVVPEGASNG